MRQADFSAGIAFAQVPTSLSRYRLNMRREVAWHRVEGCEPIIARMTIATNDKPRPSAQFGLGPASPRRVPA